MKPTAKRKPSLEQERSERVARINLATLSIPELELIECFRAIEADQRGALLVLLRHFAPQTGGAR